MSEIVCQVVNQAGQVELIWSSHGGFFRPYVVAGTPLAELRQAAGQARAALESLVLTLNQGGSPTPWEPSFALAEAGFRLFNGLLPTEDETARKVRRWLEDMRKQPGLTGLEIVVEERSTDPSAFLSVPWNLVYDERPAKLKAAFQKGQDAERWRPFWSVRYNLTSGRRVEPLKRLPTWTDPRVVVVVDPIVHDALDDAQKGRLDGFLAEVGLSAIGSLDELEAALAEGYPRLLYWLGHATPEYLMLGDERIAPGDLRNLLRSFDDRDQPEGMLAFLNACQTAEAGSGGSFLDVLHSFGFTGAIATERQTIDTFANAFGLDFLRGFLREGKPLGELLHGLRLQSAPLGLLYGAHCPPEIRVRPPGEAADAPAASPIRESGPVAGVTLGATAARGRRKRRHGRRSPPKAAPPPTVVVPPLPEAPYRSLAFYDVADRALFTGRDADVVRFAATLDLPDTRIMILHGESGIGKSSFLRAGVIPYLEEHCVGYRFLRLPDGSARIIQPAKDLIGEAAQTLLDATARAVHYQTPEGEQETVNLRPLVDEAVGAPADFDTLREALRRDSKRLADILARIAGRLPYALVVVFDQIEEVFTLARTPEEVADRDHALRMLQRVVDVRADVKLIISLRTEYYGRLLDHLRAGRRDLTGVRDDLLRDFSRSALIDAIERPTSATPLVPGQPSPRDRYGFLYAEGIAGQIADGVLAMRSENQDSVLPLVQVICTQLYERDKAAPGSDRVITREDLDAIKGVEGGLKAFAEDALERSLRLGPADRDTFKGLFSQLFNRQPDGTLTTWLMPRESLQRQWDRPTPFADVLDAARSVRLLREDELRIEGGEPRCYIRLGHDALAKVAAAWEAEVEEKQRLEQEKAKRYRQRRRLAGFAALSLTLAGLFGWLGLKANDEAHHARIAEKKATAAQDEARREADLARSAEARAKGEAENAEKSAREARRQEELARESAKEAREKAEEAREVLLFVSERILAAARPEGLTGSLGPHVTLRRALEVALPQVEPSFRGRPLVEGAVRFTLGSSFLQLGDAATAARQFRLAADRLGPDHPDTPTIWNSLANCYVSLNRPGEALALFERVLASRKAKLGPDHPETLRTLSGIASCYVLLGRRAEAMTLREQVLERMKAKLGPDHPDTMLAMNNIAESYGALGRHAEALHLFEEILRLQSAKLGPDHPDTLRSRLNLAEVYAGLGRREEAVTRYEQVLPLWVAKVGPDHPDTLSFMNNLAESYSDVGRLEEALALHRKVLSLREAKFGRDHPVTLMGLSNIARILLALDRPSESVAIIDDCLRRAQGKLVDPRVVPAAVRLRLRATQKQRDAVGCRQTAALWEKLNRTDAAGLYDAACYRAVAAGLFRADRRVPDAARQADAEARTAMGWLVKAVAAGYRTPRNLTHMTRDSDLDSLRDRDDFRRLMAELFDRVFPYHPFAG